MGLLFGDVPSKLARAVFGSVFVSLIPAVIWWFFSNVIFAFEVSFLFSWKWAFLVMVGVEILVDVVFIILVRLAFGLAFKHRLRATFSDALEGIIRYRVVTKTTWRTLTPESFAEELNLHRAADAFAKAVTDEYFR
jgi:hypothetical protein